MNKTLSQSITHLVWDWNGTLLDDLGLCLVIINGMLTKRDLPPISHQSYLDVFDFPVQDYYRRIGIDFSQQPFEEVSTEFITAYELGRPGCGLMAGAEQILSFAAKLGLTQSILSASRADYLQQAVAEYGIEDYFTTVLGIENHHAAGKLDLARRFVENSGLAPEAMLLIGDTKHDAEIALELGMGCILIPNGHHSRARLEETGCPVLPSLLDLIETLR